MITLTHDDRDLLLAEKHRPYIPDAENNFDLYAAQVLPEQRDGRETYDFTRPRQHILTTGRSWWFPSVPEIDETNAHYLKVLDVGPEDVVWDIGSYSGRSTVAFADVADRVVALEPDPVNYRCLINNLHGREDVVPIEAALWDRDGEELLEADGNQGSGITALRTDHRVTTRTVTPANLMRRTCAPSVVKLDIEGAEYRTVPAFAAIFPTIRPRFLIECHHDHGGIYPGRIGRFLYDHDYEWTVVDQPEGGPFPLLHAWPK